MNWFQPIDLYCERTSTAWWAEPFNAISNVAFLLAALWALSELRKRPPLDPLAVLLTALAATVGIGSFLFHTFANSWSELADVVPILTFVSVYAAAVLVRLAGPRLALAPRQGLLVAAFAYPGLSIGMRPTPAGGIAPSDGLNGSTQYLPIVIGLIVLSTLLILRRRPTAPWIGRATATFCAALAFRTIDLAVCPSWPIGTHFVWHLLDGLTVGLLLQALIRHSRPQAQS
jgi:hypothetical protein